MKLKFGERRVLNSSFCVAILILLAGENGLIKFDHVGSDLTLLLGNKNMKKWNFTINEMILQNYLSIMMSES